MRINIFSTIILISVFCLWQSHSIAQTNTFPTSGNVGIGTSVPSIWFSANPLPTLGIHYTPKCCFKVNLNVFAVGMKQAYKMKTLFYTNWKNEPAAGKWDLEMIGVLKRAGC